MGIDIGSCWDRQAVKAKKESAKKKENYVGSEAFDLDETQFDVAAMSASPWVVAYLGAPNGDGRRILTFCQLGAAETLRGEVPTIVVDAGPDAPTAATVQRASDYEHPLVVSCADIMSLMGTANEAGRLVLDEASARTPTITRVSIY